MAVLLKRASVRVSFIQIMQVRVQNKGKSVWKSRYVGDISFVQVFGDLCVVSYWIDTLVLKTEGNTYATLLHHPFLFKGKPTQDQEVARRISGAIAEEIYAKSSHTKYPP